MDNQIKLEFVRRVLNDEAQHLNREQSKIIAQRLNSRSGNLLNSRKYVVEAGTSSMDGKLELTHPIYERFLDMKRRSQNFRKYQINKKNRKVLHTRKSFHIHNQPIMKAFNTIGGKLLYFFTEEVAQQIKNELNLHENGK